MRITNQMVTSGSLRNMQKSMQKVNKLNEQSITGKKILAPSDDPVIAIRALKLRTTCDKLKQYKEKNIKDALNWVNTTQETIQGIMDDLEDVYYYCTQGSTDTFEEADRSKIVSQLKAFKESIYSAGGTTYAGRYLFSGYKTETNMLFQNKAAKEGLSYEGITQNISPDSIKVKNVVLNEVTPGDIDGILAGTSTYESPVDESVYRLQLAYGDLDSSGFSIEVTDKVGNQSTLTFDLADANKATVALPDGTTGNITIMSVADSANYYKVGDNDIHYIQETGELIFGKNTYNSIKDAANIEVTYNKSQFNVGDLRPELYFDCTQIKKNPDGTIDKSTQFTVSEEGQQIQYEVNFNQYVTVNAEGKDIITHAMGNCIDDMANAVQEVLDIENTINRLNTLLADPQYKDDETAVAQINKMLEDADVERALKRENMQKLFGNNMTNFQNFMSDVSAVQARVGTTYAKLELIEERVGEQLDSFDELKSSNEDVEAEEVAIELYQAELAMNAALATTSSVIQKTLLDYL